MFRHTFAAAVALAVASAASLPTAQAGALPDAVVKTRTVSKNDQQDTFTIRFKGGQRAQILVNNPSGRGDLNLVVVDDDGRVVARDNRRDDDASVSFTPRRTGTFFVKVRIQNAPRNGRPVQYTLTTN